jgi:SAM-dependent methyltransferase
MTAAIAAQLHSRHVCQSCGADKLEEIRAFAGLARVTSDSKPFPAGGRLFVCGQCGLTQKIADATWLEEIGRIYAGYAMHHQSGTPDQVVFDPVSGAPAGRCAILSQRLKSVCGVADQGSLLDVGTGSGAMVSAFLPEFPQWGLYGLDLDARKLDLLSQIPRFRQLYTCPPEQLDRRFDLITLVHVLEHFVEPVSMLRTLGQKLEPGGRLMVEVNNALQTPFDLIVADHLCHFTPSTLPAMVASAGLNIAMLKTDWIAKELSLVAGNGQRSDQQPVPQPNPADALAAMRTHLAWLQSLMEQASEIAEAGAFGIFGTSVAATWLAGVLIDKVEFFVDEDPDRVGRSHMGKPVFSPATAPASASIYLAFPGPIAQAIARRLASLPLRLILPDHTS